MLTKTQLQLRHLTTSDLVAAKTPKIQFGSLVPRLLWLGVSVTTTPEIQFGTDTIQEKNVLEDIYVCTFNYGNLMRQKKHDQSPQVPY